MKKLGKRRTSEYNGNAIYAKREKSPLHSGYSNGIRFYILLKQSEFCMEFLMQQRQKQDNFYFSEEIGFVE